MHWANSWIVIAVGMILAGCSPYVYKSEINGFTGGVNDLAAAYATGCKSVAEDRADKQRWQWTDGTAKLALTEGCVPGVAGAPETTAACTLREVGQPIPEPSAIEKNAAGAAPIVKALQDYASALGSVTNAADRQALDAAQAQLKQSVEALSKQVEPALAGSIGPIADLFASITGAILDTRRYQVLKAGVTAAKEPVRILGSAMGDALDALRTARANELRLTADHLSAGLGPNLDSGSYAVRLEALQVKIDDLEALRRANPKEAAAEMVAAHDVLAQALSDDTRNIEGVIATVKTFVDQAKAVRDAFAAEGSA